MRGHQFHVILGQTSPQQPQGQFIEIKLHQIMKATTMNQKLDFMHKGHIDIYKTNESKLMIHVYIIHLYQ